jgi:predicted nucleic acid-binding protein
MNKAFVDANVILRFLLNDPPAMAEEAARLFKAVADGDVTLILDDIIVAELVWVLKSFYQHNVADIAQVLRDFLAQPGIELSDKATLFQALFLFETKNVDFVDALVATRMQKQGFVSVFSFDKHFDRLPGIQRLAPGNPSVVES